MGDAACWAGEVCSRCGRIHDRDITYPGCRPLLVLVGLMGAGKTTVGRRVADRLGWHFVDNDELFIDHTGTTASGYAAEHGDAAMHEMEWRLVADVLARQEPTVFAAPGSVVEAPSLDLDEVFVVWLQVEPSLIASRLSVGDHRPLLGDQPESVLQQLLEERSERYRGAADLVVDASDSTPEDLAARIIEAWGERAPDPER